MIAIPEARRGYGIRGRKAYSLAKGGGTRVRRLLFRQNPHPVCDPLHGIDVEFELFTGIFSI